MVKAVFQQNSTPCHVAKVMTNYSKEKSVSYLEWLENSPDLNPIQNMWANVKARFRKIDCTKQNKTLLNDG